MVALPSCISMKATGERRGGVKGEPVEFGLASSPTSAPTGECVQPTPTYTLL